MKYLELLGKEPFKSIIYMLEQPFPVELTKVEVLINNLKILVFI